MKKPVLKVVSDVSDMRQNGDISPLRTDYAPITPNNYTDDIEAEYIKAAKKAEDKAKKQAEIINKCRQQAIKLIKTKRVIELVLDASGTDQAAMMAYVSGLKAIALDLVPDAPITLSKVRELMDKLTDRQVNTKASQLLQNAGFIVKKDDGNLRYANLSELELAAGGNTRRATRAASLVVGSSVTLCKVGIAHLAGGITRSPYVSIDKNGKVTRYERFEETEEGKNARRRLEAAKRDEDMARREMLAKNKAAQMRNGVDPYQTTGQFGSAKTWLWGAGILTLLAIAATSNQPQNNAPQFPAEPQVNTQRIEQGE